MVEILRDEQLAHVLVEATHDGYAKAFGFYHTRWVRLSSDGHWLEGEDRFTAANGRAPSAKARDDFAVRFHLHPAIKPTRLSDRRSVTLLLPDREIWTFATTAEAVTVEESVFLADSQSSRRTTQIVIYGNARSQPVIRWGFRHMPQALRGSRLGRTSEEPELPL